MDKPSMDTPGYPNVLHAGVRTTQWIRKWILEMSTIRSTEAVSGSENKVIPISTW